MPKGRVFAVVGGILAAVGVTLLSVAIAVAVSTAGFLASAERADGVVIDRTERTSTTRDSDGHRRQRTRWYPTVEFESADGTVVEFESSVGSNPAAFEIGESVPVAYDPDDPFDARIATFGFAYLVPIILGGLGLVFAPVGAVVFIRGRRTLRRRAWLREHGRKCGARSRKSRRYGTSGSIDVILSWCTLPGRTRQPDGPSPRSATICGTIPVPA